MDKKFYEFLFELRASGFIHHTPEANQSANSFTAQRSNLRESLAQMQTLLDGETGSLSDNIRQDLRNMYIGINFVLSHRAIEQNHVNAEYAHSLSDYFINRLDTLTTPAQYEKLFYETIDQYLALMEQKQRPSYGRTIDRCIHYIDQNLYAPLTAAEVARYTGLSAAHLTTVFRQKTGISLYQYIQNEKISEAKDLLRNTSQPVTAIATALGYNSLPHFSNAFTAATGMRPRQYREAGMTNAPT